MIYCLGSRFMHETSYCFLLCSIFIYQVIVHSYTVDIVFILLLHTLSTSTSSSVPLWLSDLLLSSTFWKSILNTSWAVGLTYRIAYLYFLKILTYAIIYVLIHHIIFWLFVCFLIFFIFSNTPVLTSSIDVVFVLAIIVLILITVVVIIVPFFGYAFLFIWTVTLISGFCAMITPSRDSSVSLSLSPWIAILWHSMLNFLLNSLPQSGQ